MKTYEITKLTGKAGDSVTSTRNAKLEDLMRTTGPKAYSMAYQLTGNSDDADNLVKERGSHLDISHFGGSRDFSSI